MALNDMPGHLLRRCHQISVAIFLDECEEFDLTPLQYAVLVTLCEQGSQDQATLGGAAALDRTTTAVVVKKLEERKFITRKQSAKDKRSKIVTITARGRTFVKQSTPLVDRAQDRMIGPLNSAESAQLITLLSKLAHENNKQSRAPPQKQATQVGLKTDRLLSPGFCPLTQVFPDTL